MERFGLKLIILCLFFAIVLPFVTLLYIVKFFHPFLVVTLIVNISVFILVAICYFLERGMENK